MKRIANQQKTKRYRHRRQLTALLSVSAALIVLATLEALILANPEAYQFWLTLYPAGTAADYSSIVLSIFLVDIVVPVTISLYTFFTIRKYSTPLLYRLIWGAIIFLAGIRRLLMFQTKSILWFLALALWGALFLIVINIHRLETVPGDYEETVSGN
ncbi:MAG TPA: hypothetical protein GXZ59_01715 [Clostridiaceae bacterium]|nr:hypothetical protein [Clostridiaceae bacterium]